MAQKPLAQRGIVDGKRDSNKHGSTLAKGSDRLPVSYIFHLIGCQGPILGLSSLGSIGEGPA
jgi:hypothetical protein